MKFQEQEKITLLRDVEATEIPYGTKINLYKGTEVTLTQSLGGTFTVITHQGQMVSLSGKDADALGKDKASEISLPKTEAGEIDVEKAVWGQLRTCYDPEIPHNIVDLGLIYECKIEPINEAGDKKVSIVMTLTAPGCGMGDWLSKDARNKILTIPTVKDCNVQVTFDPPWDRSKMSPALRREFM
ncbi:MAG: putative Fe-S cluster assembly protein SufT [Candidatus Omnitrophica bacterium]|nr:putative Fe-S cluster assembly protein SufT [Candidatus Omnitrophota bacterium]